MNVYTKSMTNFDGRGMRECLRVEVSGEDYLEVEKESDHFWARDEKEKKNPSQYTKGVGNSQDDPHRASRTGLLGEVAFGKIIGLPADIAYKKGGQKEDFTLPVNLPKEGIKEYSLDVKTAMSLRDAKGLIQCVNSRGKVIPLHCDYYVFSFISKEDRQSKKAYVTFAGFLWKHEMKKYGLKQGRRGSSHKNIEVPYEDTRLIDLMLNWFNLYKSNSSD